jgi:hypothetical protein
MHKCWQIVENKIWTTKMGATSAKSALLTLQSTINHQPNRMATQHPAAYRSKRELAVGLTTNTFPSEKLASCPSSGGKDKKVGEEKPT